MGEASTHLKWGFPSKTLKHNGSNTPQVSLGIIGLWHDDLWSLVRGAFQGYNVHVWNRVPSKRWMEDTCHIHGGAAEGGGHHVVLEVPCEAKVGCGERGNSSGDYFQKTRRFTSCKKAWGGANKKHSVCSNTRTRARGICTRVRVTRKAGNYR